MKRAILILIFLTVAVTLPPFYLQWAESQRLNQIQEVKQQARPIFGERLETVLSELKSSGSPSVVYLIYRWHKKPSGAMRVLSRTVRWPAETCTLGGAASSARIPNISR